MVKCGAAGVLYQYPAWSFGGRPPLKEQGADGPGPGGFVPSNTFDGPGYNMGYRSYSGRAATPAGAAYIPDGKYLKPGYLTQERQGPAYSFGSRLPSRDNGAPGPLSYDPFTSTANKAATWGPPPRTIRPASAPRARTIEDRPAPKPRGPTMGGPWTGPRPDPTPGPLDYQCNCGGGCCKYCDSYKGATIKGRQPLFYGKVTTITPGPANYHTECSTIGAATMDCEGAKKGGSKRGSGRLSHSHSHRH
eukprot:CAMPEP_0202890498 /NCGR_PEP_ID=MMETSP1392-20130828/876_1 /ASSEMBLY_ACC=CAM_ASM_000868 /TAXON_ID=225041 /ORGANISM="Chlamydomonas chlamydogama, Strain SAG 11-48b" /LENGTH=247 /DNA_ID=CAMNT_0049574075 /DNA_START=126 /DNA_END=869 /DNA_ORIENTATION=+